MSKLGQSCHEICWRAQTSCGYGCITRNGLTFQNTSTFYDFRSNEEENDFYSSINHCQKTSFNDSFKISSAPDKTFQLPVDFYQSLNTRISKLYTHVDRNL